MIGYAGNYAYHLITGRMLSEIEYGLLIALFGIINLLLLPMSALGLAFTRAISIDLEHSHGSGLKNLTVKGSIGMTGAAFGILVLAVGFSGSLQQAFGFNRLAPIFLAACILGTNLLLTLSGSLLQGLQQFKGLALRGSLLFVLRALLVGFCLFFGWRAAGWALLAHLLGMVVALGVSFWVVKKHLPAPDLSHRIEVRPILMHALRLAPLLLAFSTLMTADVILAKHYFDPLTSGQFAQAATLGRMILWLPLPIAQVMFPKVDRKDIATDAQRHTLFKALGYTLILILGALVVGWVGAPYALRWIFGISSPSRKPSSKN
jgi:O-antigen/teichoic acid export membrane protein